MKKAATDDSKLVMNIENIVAAIGKAFAPGLPSTLQVAAAQVRRD